jgi:hypothetical protein
MDQSAPVVVQIIFRECPDIYLHHWFCTGSNRLISQAGFFISIFYLRIKYYLAIRLIESMKKLILFLLGTFALSLTKAQSSIAITGGIQNAWVSPDFILYPDTLKKFSTQKTGIVFGFTATVPIKKNLFFQTGVVYSAKGSNWTQYYDTTNLYATTANLPSNKKSKPFSTNTKLNVNYIDIPLNVKYRLPLKKSSSFTIGAGPQASIFYSGNLSSFTINVSQDSLTASSVRTSIKTEENSDLPVGQATANYRVLHFGMNAFIGMEFNRVYFHIHYAKDLNELYEEGGRKYKNKTIGLRIGVLLGQQKTNGSHKNPG